MESTAEVQKEERKQPQQRGRGGRGRGGNYQNKHPRPQTEGENPRQNRRGNAPSEANKDSYYYKYHFGPFPTHERIEITLDTPTPAGKPKDQLLKEPSKEDYAKRMISLDNEIENLRKEIQTISQSKQDKLKIRREENAKDKEQLSKSKLGNLSFNEIVAQKKIHRAKLNERFEEVKKIKNERDSIEDEL